MAHKNNLLINIVISKRYFFKKLLNNLQSKNRLKKHVYIFVAVRNCMSLAFLNADIANNS